MYASQTFALCSKMVEYIFHVMLTVNKILLFQQFSIHRKSIFNHIQCFIHFNLSLSLLLGLIIFVAGIEAANDSEVSYSYIIVK